MSSAFLKEGEDLWLRDIAPTMDALIHYLTKENGGIRITEKGIVFNELLKKEVYKMSDGFCYVVINNVWNCVD